MMRSLKQQHGMTAIGWLLVLTLIIVISLLIIKILPIYMNTFKITSALNSLKTDQLAQGKSATELKKMLLNRFDIDMLQVVTADEITVTRGDHVYNVRVEHQFKEEMLTNLYIVLVVDEAVDIPIQQ
jgi:Domain of unknown function (DUF4845)